MAEDIVIEMATEKLDNSKEVRVSRTLSHILTSSAVVDEWGTVTTWEERIIDKIEDAVLYPYMYDATKILYKDNIGTDLSLVDSVKNFEFSLCESIGQHQSFEMNMYTRKDANNVDHWNEKIYYNDSFDYNPDTGLYSLVIYTPTKAVSSENVQMGYNDSVISIEENMSAPVENDYERVSIEYRTNLPPFIIQGIPKKLNPAEEDPVFPTDASRVDIGVNQIPDYFQNSQGYTQDYLFTNSSAMYVADASGFLPREISNDYTFSAVSAYLEDENTTMRTPIEFEVNDSANIDELSAEITTNGSTTSYSAQLERVVWRSKIESQTSGTIMNLLTIEAAVEPKSNEV
jgi:hypothetical protein